VRFNYPLAITGVRKVQSLAQYCLECGGTLSYDPVLKQYSCKSCGLTFTFQQLLEGKGQLMDRESVDEQRKRRQKEYLNWWLSKK
jgi:hypothetical protein